MTPYERTFGLRSLNGMVSAFGKEEDNHTLFQDFFKRGRRMTTMSGGGSVEWDEIQLARSLAPVVGRDSKFPLRQMTTKINRRSAVAHLKESVVIPAAKLYGERGPGELFDNAPAVVDQELRNLVKRQKATIEYMAAHTMNGTLTVSAANIPGTTIPFTLTYSPNTYTASASWATAGTGLVSSELTLAKMDYYQNAGLQPRRVICGATISGYFSGNTELVTLMSNQAGLSMARGGAALFGQALEGFQVGGLDWHVTEGGYVPDGGSWTRYIAATDDAFMLPGDEDLGDVLGFAEGYGFVPGNDVGPAAAAAGLVRRAPSSGFYSYAVREMDPPGVRLFVGWVGLPILLFPSGVMVLDVVP